MVQELQTPQRFLMRKMAEQTHERLTKGDVLNALDGDQVEELSMMFQEELNYLNGNMTEEEYNNLPHNQ